MIKTSNTTEYEERILREKCTHSSLQNFNPYLTDDTDGDILYHITLGTKSHDLPKMFEDIKFVVLGATPKRMKQFAHFLLKDIGYELPPGTTLNNISSRSHSYAMFKVGPVLCVSHGTGTPSMGTILNELIKMVYHARIKDPTFIKIGSCGGFGTSKGDIVITNKVFNEHVDPSYELCILGSRKKFATDVDQNLVDELEQFSRGFNFDITTGATFCSDDFYEGSGRSDGCICKTTHEERIRFFTFLQNLGIVNTEMESTAFTALTRRAGIKSAVVTVVTDDKMRDDQQWLLSNLNDDEWELKLFKFVSAFIKERLNIGGSRDTTVVKTLLTTTVSKVGPQDVFQLGHASTRSSTKVVQAPPASSFQYDGLSSYRNVVWSDSDKCIHSPTSEFGNWYDGGPIIADKTNPVNRYDSLLSESRNEFCSKCGVTLPGKSTNPNASLDLGSQPPSPDRDGEGSSTTVTADCPDSAPTPIQIKPSLKLSAENITRMNDRYTAKMCATPSPEQGFVDDSTNRNNNKGERTHSIYPEYRAMSVHVVTEQESSSTTASQRQNPQLESSENQCISDSSPDKVEDEKPENGTSRAADATPSPFSRESILEKLRQAEFNANRSCNQERKCDAASDIFNKEQYLRSVLKKARESDQRETTTAERETDASLSDQTKCREESSASHSEGGSRCPDCTSPPRSKTELHGEQNTARPIDPSVKSPGASEADDTVREHETTNARGTSAESGLKTMDIRQVLCEEPKSLNLIRLSDSINSTTTESASTSCRGVIRSQSGGSSQNSWSETNVTDDVHDPEMIVLETSPMDGLDSPNESSTPLYCEHHTDLLLKIQETTENSSTSTAGISSEPSQKSLVLKENVDSPNKDEYAPRYESDSALRKEERKLPNEHGKKRKLN